MAASILASFALAVPLGACGAAPPGDGSPGADSVIDSPALDSVPLDSTIVSPEFDSREGRRPGAEGVLATEDLLAVPASERPLGRDEFRDCESCPVMVWLPPGRFVMGRAPDEAPAATTPNRPARTERAEGPRVEGEIGYPFAIGKYEVTWSEWERCVAAGGCTRMPDDAGFGRGDRPVIHVSHADAMEYVAWLTELTGQPYRLPSEAEWEYAARGGTTTARWWGDEVGVGNTVCERCGSRWDNRSTAPVGSFAPNPFGLHDMLGNVSEWIADCWHPNHEGQPADGSARIETSEWWKDGACERPMIKGGAWGFYSWTTRAANRGFYFPRPIPPPWPDHSDSRGFRVARDL